MFQKVILRYINFAGRYCKQENIEMAKKKKAVPEAATTTAPMGKKRKVNKTEAVKKVLVANPAMPPRQVVDTLKKKNVTVTAAYVSTIKTTLKKNGDLSGKPAAPQVTSGRPVGRPKGSGKKTTAAKTSISVADLQAAKALIDSVGSIDGAMQALNTLSTLRGN